jgi:hypothetical protein
VNRLLARLAQTGLTAERSAAAKRPDGATVAITVRAP